MCTRTADGAVAVNVTLHTLWSRYLRRFLKRVNSEDASLARLLTRVA